MLSPKTHPGKPRAHDAAEIQRAITALRPSGVLEIRILDIPGRGKPHGAAGYFQDAASAARAVVEFDKRHGPGGIYLLLNDADPQVYARSPDQITEHLQTTVSDNEIQRRCRLFIDCDPKRPRGVAATDDQHDAALEFASRLCELLHEEHGWPDPAEIDSGNGAYLIYGIDLPNDKDSTKLVENVLKGLDQLAREHYQSEGRPAVHIDHTTHNAARIARLPGTINRKGQPTAEQPHRPARLLSAPPELVPVSAEKLKQIADLVAEVKPKPQAKPSANGKQWSRLLVPEWLRARGVEFETYTGGSETKYVLARCPFNESHTAPDAAIFQYASGAMHAKCLHNSCAGNGWPEFKMAIGTPESHHFDPPLCERQKPAEDHQERPKPAGKGGCNAENGLVTTCLATIQPVPIHWLVPGVLPLGKLVLLAGDGGHGKSTLTLDMAARLTRGRPCLGREYTPLPRCEVLLISCEDDYADTVVPRLLSAGADLLRIHRVDGITKEDGKPAPFTLAHYAEMEAELTKRPDIRLVVIDPAGAYIGKTGVDDHKDSDLRGLLGPMAELAARRRVTIVLVKHLIKGATAKAVHKVDGGVGYVNSVRAAFVVAPDKDDDNKKLLLPIKFNPGQRPDGRAYRMRGLDVDDQLGIIDNYGSHLNDEDKKRLAAQLYRIEWLGSVDDSADDVLGETPVRMKRAEEAASWLNTFLAKHAYPSEEILAAGEKAGFSRKNLFDAKREAGIKASNKGSFMGQWWWGLGDVANWQRRVLP
jgi:hypothetical protein